MTATSVQRQLEELHLLRCSMIAGETLTFISSDSSSVSEAWAGLLDMHSESTLDLSTQQSLWEDLKPAQFLVRLEGAPLWFDVKLPSDYPAIPPVVLVRGDEISRSEHERWQSIVQEKQFEVKDSEYPLYELISTHLLPSLRDEGFSSAPVASQAAKETTKPPNESSNRRYHALLTSHHLISPTKRRSLQGWSSQLSISGFAKVGYPGVIYCEGVKDQVEEFVSNIKAMQWLALRVRFIEPAPEREGGSSSEPSLDSKRTWQEFEKVGEVVDEMRRLGREKYVVEMGIGSAGKT